MPRPITATIHISAMQHNLAVAKAHAPAAKTWGVVKANAYGHGLARALRAFSAADGLALIEIDGAVRLREMGWKKPILLLEGFFQPIDLEAVVEHQLECAIHCNEQIEMIEQAAISAPLNLHLKMNSGMNRLGFTPDAFHAAYQRVRAIPAVQKITLMTQFARADDADNPGLPLARQLRLFEAGSAGIDA